MNLHEFVMHRKIGIMRHVSLQPTLFPIYNNTPYACTCIYYTTDIEVLHEREDWQVQSEEGGIVTSLPVLFENVVVETLLSLKEIVIVNLADGDKKEGVAGEVDSRDNKELRDNTVGHFQGLWDVRTSDYIQTLDKCLESFTLQL